MKKELVWELFGKKIDDTKVSVKMFGLKRRCSENQNRNKIALQSLLERYRG